MHVAEDNGYCSLFYFHVDMSEDELKEMSERLFADESYGNIYRIKGFVPAKPGDINNLQTEALTGNAVDSASQPETSLSDAAFIQINATREQVEITHTDNGQEVIIVIGEHLDNARIEEYIRSCSHEKDITAGQSDHSHAHAKPLT